MSTYIKNMKDALGVTALEAGVPPADVDAIAEIVKGEVNKADVGLSEVDNTSDAQKAASGPIGDRLAEIQFDDSVLNPNDAVAYTAGIQSRLDSLNLLGGGRLVITRGNKKLQAPYRGTDGIFPGYVASDENRRANKAVIIYNMANITIDFLPGAVWDRSADVIADTVYAEYSCALYISKSRNIHVNDYNGVGTQNDAALLTDVKNITSGDHIQINNNCDGIYINRPICQDGTTNISVGLSRTSAFQQLDPAIPACRNIFINDFDGRNSEHDIILFKAYGVWINGVKSRTYQRTDGTTGVKQRGLYLHSCKGVYVNGIEFDGIFKTCLLIGNYDAVEDVFIRGFNVKSMMTPVALAAGGGTFDPAYYGHAVSLQSDNCKNVEINGFRIGRVAIGFAIPGIGHKGVRFMNGQVDAVYSPFITISGLVPSGTTLNNPAAGLALQNIEMTQLEDPTNYGSVAPNSGMHIQSLAVDGGAAALALQGLSLENVSVKARTRNARVLDCSGAVKGCNFTQSLGLAGARNYDFNYTGDLKFSGNTFGNNGRPNGNQDQPAVASILGYIDEEIRLPTVAANTTFTVPAGYAIESIFVANTTANAVTGGIKIGTTSGATDVVAAYAVAASAIGSIPDAQILKRMFSLTATQTLYLQAVTAWNSASLRVTVRLRKVM